jgi:hypothetical protein
MSWLTRLIDRAVAEFGEEAAPAARRIVETLGNDATGATVRAAVRREGYKPLSANRATAKLREAATPPKPKEKPLAVKAETPPARRAAATARRKAATRTRTTEQPTRRTPPVEEMAVRPGRKGFEARLRPPSEKPVVTQAGELGIPVSGLEQMAVAHPSPFGAFSTIKPRKPAPEVTSDYLPAEEFGPPTPGRNEPLAVFDPDAPRKSFAVEDLENAMVISLLGDRMSAGRRITDIDGTPVNVMTYGGPRYGEFNEAMGSPAVWASERSPISSLRKQIRGGLEEGRDVYGVYTAMGPKSLDQTTMMTDALLQQVRGGDIKKRDLAVFDRAMRGIVPDFVGVKDPGAYQQLAGLTQGDRIKFVQFMDSAKALDAGFPSVSATRIGLTEPELTNAPAGSTGFSVMKLGPESLEDFDISLLHPTYPVQMAGETAGRFPEMVPFDMVFSDLVSARRGAGASAGKDLRALELRKPSQVVTPEQIERLLKYLETSAQR